VAEFTLGLTGPFSHGRGFSEPAAVTQPAAGSGFTITVGSQYWERLTALTFRLVTSAVVANRQVSLTATSGDGVPLAIFPAASVQAASLTWDYSFLPNLSTFNTVSGLVVTAPAPTFFLQPGYTLVVAVGAVDVGDQLSRIRFYRERFSTGPGGYRQGMVSPAELYDLSVARLAEVVS
jgi:hypothetical protein